MTITLDLPDEVAARLAADEENANLLDRLNAAYAPFGDTEDIEEHAHLEVW